jgi:hypothetical protein
MRKLSTCAPTVNQSISMAYFPGDLGDDVVPERVGEDQNHRDHEAVDGRGLDHRQTNEQVRVMVAEASGCCASELSAVATARPSPSEGPIRQC